MAQPAAASSSASGRRRGHRKIASWRAVFCFGGSRRERDGEQALAAEGTPRWRKQRTVPVDGDPVPADRDVTRRGAGDKASRKGLRKQGCCFLAPERKDSTMDDSGSGAHDKQRQLEHTKPRPPRSPSEAPAPSSQMQDTTDGSGSRRAEQPRGGAPAETTRARAAARPSDNEASSKREAPARGGPCPPKAKASSAGGGVGAFGPVVGLSVVAAVSMAGLLGGRLWAVACVCAWLAALSRVSRRAAGSDGGGEEAVADVDSTGYKKLVVLRRLLERDRTKAVKA